MPVLQEHTMIVFYSIRAPLFQSVIKKKNPQMYFIPYTFLHRKFDVGQKSEMTS